MTDTQPIPPDLRPQIVRPGRPTPTLGSGGTLTFICSTTISAPISTIAAVLLDTTTYPSWNPFCPRVIIDQQPSAPPPLPSGLSSVGDLPTTFHLGTVFTFADINLGEDGGRKASSSLEVSVLEEFERDGRKGFRVAWRSAGMWAKYFANIERVQELVEAADKGEDGGVVVEYSSWETFYGWVGPWVIERLAGEAVKWGLGAWMDGLKEYAEKQAREE